VKLHVVVSSICLGGVLFPTAKTEFPEAGFKKELHIRTILLTNCTNSDGPTSFKIKPDTTTRTPS
jgi:hypothetical protein